MPLVDWWWIISLGTLSALAVVGLAHILERLFGDE